MANLDLQLEAIAFVDRNKVKIFKAMSARNSRLTWDDLEDCVSDGYVFVLELVGKGLALAEIKKQFWRMVYRAGWDSYDYLLSPVNLKENDHRIDPASVQAVTTPLGDRLEQEEATSSALGAVAQTLLSPGEAEVFLLMAGETRNGNCSVAESASILGRDRETVRTLCRRATQKLQGYKIGIQPDGSAIVWSKTPPPKRTRAHHLAAEKARFMAGVYLQYAA